MNPEESQLFQLLDEYSRAHYKCFLAEMFLDRGETEYVLCFRPANEGPDSADRYSCRYLRVKLTDARDMGQRNALTAAITDRLDRELLGL
jgi:hypothetical protein